MLEPVELQNNMHTHLAKVRAFLPQNVLGILVLLKLIFDDLLCFATRPVEVFCRTGFGARGHSSFQVVQMTFTAGAVCMVLGTTDGFIALFSVASAAFGIYHLVESRLQEKYGAAPRFSWSHGEPVAWIWTGPATALRAIGLKPDSVLAVSMICRFGEPILCLSIGLAFWYAASKMLGGYLCFAAAGMFIKGVIIHNRMLNLQRDSIDSKIFGTWMSGIQKKFAGQCDEKFHVVQVILPGASEPDGAGSAEPPPSPEQKAPHDTAIVADDLLKFNCRKCKTEFHLHPKHAGKKGRCRKCGELNLVVAPQPT